MQVKNIYTSIACNRTTECADWGRNGWIVFGASHAVGICDPRYLKSSARIIHSFVRHKKRVNTVRWLSHPTLTHETLFLSGADDSLALLWDITNPTAPQCYPLKGHESGINAVYGIYGQKNQNELLLATAAADSTVKLWRFDLSAREQCECLQTILLNRGFCFALSLTYLPRSEHILLAFSSDDESLALWSKKWDDSEFRMAHKLTGHEDWIRSLDFIQDGDDDLLLASCAQDNFIRLWRISYRTEDDVLRNSVNLFNLENTPEIRVEEKILKLGDDYGCAVSLESVLYGHDGWVFGIHWHKSEHGMRLLSASIDKTLIIWEAAEEGVWMEKVRVGGVGGNSLGFYGGKFSHDGKSIFGHSFQGGFHIWNQSEDNENIWNPNVIVGGHFGEVRDIGWEPRGEYLMSVSADQTTRIHAPWIRNDLGEAEATWHELARPQVHGYDMQTLAILSRYKFATGAEEKIVRTFQASTNFIENFRRIANIKDDSEGDALLAELPKGASVPSLGLSNKAVYSLEEPATEANHVKDEYPENYFIPTTLEAPPQEETLMQNTLWPEVQKLYGHGYEVYALAASPDGQMLASSCKATNAYHAQIILWNTRTWKQVQKLESHQLTVTQMCFSPNGQYLLSVSRDRRWTLFEKENPLEPVVADEVPTDGVPTFTEVATTDKNNGVHTRIIWSCDFSHDSVYFGTSSRDGKLVIWGQIPTTTKAKSQHCNLGKFCVSSASVNGWLPCDVLELKNESVTALAFAKQCLTDGNYIIALGLETGSLKVYRFAKNKLAHLLNISNDDSHHLTVRRLQFRPNTEKFQLASCGDDNFVKIYELCL